MKIRKALKAEKEAEANSWTIERLWTADKDNNPELKGIPIDDNRFLNYLKPIFGDREPRELSSLAVDRLRVRLEETQKPGTVKNVLELLRRIINFGVKKNLCDRLSFTIEMPKVHNQKTEDLSPEQPSTPLDAIEADTNVQARNVMKMALSTVMRRGELFKLKWEDIHFDRGFIHIKNPKGGSDQTIPLNDAARDLLNFHIQTESPFVFPGRGGSEGLTLSIK